MIIWTAPQRPVKLSFRFLDRGVIDGRQAQPHQAVLRELPILVAVRTEPMPRVVVPFVRETHGNAILLKSPKLLNESIVEFIGPLASQERDDRAPPMQKFRAVSRPRVKRVG